MKGHPLAPGTAAHCKRPARVGANSFRGCHVAGLLAASRSSGPALLPPGTPLLRRNACVRFLFLQGEKALSQQNSPLDPAAGCGVASWGSGPSCSLEPQVPSEAPPRSGRIGGRAQGRRAGWGVTSETVSPGRQL